MRVLIPLAVLLSSCVPLIHAETLTPAVMDPHLGTWVFVGRTDGWSGIYFCHEQQSAEAGKRQPPVCEEAIQRTWDLPKARERY